MHPLENNPRYKKIGSNYFDLQDLEDLLIHLKDHVNPEDREHYIKQTVRPEIRIHLLNETLKRLQELERMIP